MSSIARKHIPLAHQLSCEVLGLKSVDKLDYYEPSHVIALSLAVNEVLNRRGLIDTKHWKSICDAYQNGYIYRDVILESVMEYFLYGYGYGYYVNLSKHEDLEAIAFFTMKYVGKELSIDKEYFYMDLTEQIADIVLGWQYDDQKNREEQK